MMAYKRPRETFSQSSGEVAAVIIDINQAIASNQRIRALKRLLPLAELYSAALIQGGAISALCLQIGFVLNKPCTSVDELGLVCCGVETLLRNSSEFNIDAMVQDIGGELLNLLEKVLHKQRSLQPLVFSILRLCTGSPTGAMKVATNQVWLSIIVSVLLEDTTKKRVIDEAIGVVKNVTHFAEDYRSQILEHPGLSSALSRLPFMTVSERTSDRLSLVFRNLALTPTVRIAMVEDQRMLSGIVRLCGNCKNIPRIVRNVVTAFCTLAMEVDLAVSILLHGDGIVLNMLIYLMTSNEDEVIRKRAARTIKLLSRDKAIPLLINSPELLDVLYQSATQDPNCEVRTEATEAFSLCSTGVDAQMSRHSHILNCLIHLANGVAVESVSAALNQQAKNASNRILMGQNTELLRALALISVGDRTSLMTREHVTQTFQNLSAEESVRETMAIEPVLQALVDCAAPNGHDEELSNSAVRALINLATVESNRRLMVTHTGLLKALMAFASSCQDGVAKNQVKRTILELVPLL